VIAPSEVERRLLEAFPGSEVEISDLTGSQDHFQARIVSALFEGKSPVEQHQLVYRALAEEMQGPIHALALRTYTPSAWARAQGTST
jgi:stress-induced morphogen